MHFDGIRQIINGPFMYKTVDITPNNIPDIYDRRLIQQHNVHASNIYNENKHI